MNKWTYWLFIIFMAVSSVLLYGIFFYLREYTFLGPLPLYLVLLLFFGVIGSIICVFIPIYTQVPDVFSKRWVPRARGLLFAVLALLIFFDVGFTPDIKSLYSRVSRKYLFIDYGDPGCESYLQLSFQLQNKFIPVAARSLNFDNFVSSGLHVNSSLDHVYKLIGDCKFGDSVVISSGILQKAKVIDRKITWSSIGNIEVRSPSMSGFKSILLEQIAEKLKVGYSPLEKQEVAKTYTNNLEAYKLCLEGAKFYSRYSQEALKSAIDLFNESIDLDLNFACPYAGIADCYNQLYARLWDPRLVTLMKAQRYINTALVLSPNAMHPHKAAGLLYQNLGSHYFREFDHSQEVEYLELSKSHYNRAIDEYQTAIVIAPTSSIARNNLATVYIRLAKIAAANKESKEAQSKLDKAQEILKHTLKENPLSPPLYINYGVLFLNRYKYGLSILPKSILADSVITYLKYALSYSSIESEKGMAFYNLACLYSLEGQYDSALAYLDSCSIYCGFNFYLAIKGDKDLHLDGDKDFTDLQKNRKNQFEAILEKLKTRCHNEDFLKEAIVQRESSRIFPLSFKG